MTTPCLSLTLLWSNFMTAMKTETQKRDRYSPDRVWLTHSFRCGCCGLGLVDVCLNQERAFLGWHGCEATWKLKARLCLHMRFKHHTMPQGPLAQSGPCMDPDSPI